MISETDYLRVIIARVIAEHMGTFGVEQYFLLADKIYAAIKEYADKAANDLESRRGNPSS